MPLIPLSYFARSAFRVTLSIEFVTHHSGDSKAALAVFIVVLTQGNSKASVFIPSSIR